MELYESFNVVIPIQPINPVALTAVAVSSSQINLTVSWSGGSLQGIFVNWSTSPSGPWTGLTSFSTNTGSYSHTGLSASATYYYEAYAVVPGPIYGPTTYASATTSTSQSGFFADPYSAFTSYIADITFAGTNGTSTTVSWNGSTITGPTYSTPQAAINAAAAAGPGSNGTRVCFLKSQTWNVSGATLTCPSTAAFTASLPLVFQGDPSCTWSRSGNTVTSNMPYVTGNGGPGAGFFLGYNGASAVNNQYIVIYKLRIGNFIDSTGTGVAGVQLRNDGSYVGFKILYCEFGIFQATGGAGESGPIYLPIREDSTAFEVGYCKLHDIFLPGGSTAGINENHSCVGLYGGVANIHNCEMWASYNGVRFKGNNVNTPNGSVVKNCYIHDLQCGISYLNGGGTPGPYGIQVTGCLFGWENLYNSAVQAGSFAINDFGSDSGNATPPPQQNTCTNCTIAQGWQGGYANSASASCIFQNNIVLCGNGTLTTAPIWTDKSGHPGSFSTVDYDFYFGTGWTMNAEGSPGVTMTTWAQWQAAHTNNPSLTGLSANPDAHGGFIPNFTSPYNTIAGNFPNQATPGGSQYQLATGSPMKAAGIGGADPGCGALILGW